MKDMIWAVVGFVIGSALCTAAIGGSWLLSFGLCAGYASGLTAVAFVGRGKK